jgi:5-formyltetrahydrofolate cyclo-ligase
MSETGADKKALRAQALALLRSLTPSQREKMDARILQRVQQWPQWASIRALFAYYSDPDEPLTHALITAALNAGKRVGLPRVEKKTKRMRVLEVKSIPGDMEPGYAGLFEPKNDLPEIDPASLDAVLLPGRAFDAQGNRLGRGAGHYDRWLGSGAAGMKLFAIAYECQIGRALPAEAHDVPVQWIFTEDRTIEVRS